VSDTNKKITDYSGHENLELMAQTHKFNDWMYNETSISLKGDILEVGSGLGTFSKKIIHDFPLSHITLTDVSPNYVNELKKIFHNERISVHKLDLNSETDYNEIGYERFDSVIAINVLEHVKNDEFALQQLYKMLKKGGTLSLLVPCHKFLFNVIDESVGHFRRYTKQELTYKIKKTGFSIDKMHYFNILGMIGWYINGNLAKNPKVNPKASIILDATVPLSKVVEKLSGKSIGLSMICHLRK